MDRQALAAPVAAAVRVRLPREYGRLRLRSCPDGYVGVVVDAATRTATVIFAVGGIDRFPLLDAVDQDAGVGVLDHGRIDVEDHRHLAGLASLEALLGKAEALHLVEIDTDFERRHVEGGGAGHRLVGKIYRAIGNTLLFARMHLHRELQGTKLPAEIRRRFGVEAHGNEPVGDLLFRRGAGALRRAAIAGHLAEQTIERHGSSDEAAPCYFISSTRDFRRRFKNGDLR